MADIFNKNVRSRLMSAVRSAGNKTTELALAELFRMNNYCGWRRSYLLYGKPDFVFPQRKVVVFADGCFWHGHNCRNTQPKNNYRYWHDKISNNKSRDKKVSAYLKSHGWHVFRIWECNIAKGKLPRKLVILLKGF